MPEVARDFRRALSKILPRAGLVPVLQDAVFVLSISSAPQPLWELVPVSGHYAECFSLLSTWIFPCCNWILLSVVLLLCSTGKCLC